MSEYSIIGKIRQLASPSYDLAPPRVTSPPTPTKISALLSAAGGRGVTREPHDLLFDYQGLNLYDRRGRVRTVLVPIGEAGLGVDTWEPRGRRG